MEKSRDALRTISEVADWLGVPTHVLRFWESRFSQIRPIKRAGRRRYYRPSDMALLGGIRKLLHDDGMTIRGVQKILREQGVGSVAALASVSDSQIKENEASSTVSDSQDLAVTSPIGNDRSQPEDPETSGTKGHTAKSAADEPEPSTVSRAPTITGTAAREETNIASAETNEAGSRELADRSHPPGSHVEESASPPPSAETDQDAHKTIEGIAGAGTRSGQEDSIRPADTNRSAPDGDTAKLETYDAILDIYSRLLALRNRMGPASQRSVEDQS